MSTTAIKHSDNIDNITPYELITLLLDGALERIDSAMKNLNDGDNDEAFILINKTIGIVGGLRQSLNFEMGGDIAINLNALYEYIINELEHIGQHEPLVTLNEVKDLLSEVYLGWQNMDHHLPS